MRKFTLYSEKYFYATLRSIHGIWIGQTYAIHSVRVDTAVPGSEVYKMNLDEQRSHRENIENWEDRKTPVWVVILWAAIISIPLGLCCYLLLS